jgi:HD superfamily phosphohydrolase
MRSSVKVINDPVYGFISLPDPLLLEILDQPVVQRLRRIRQMGLAHLVYPGAHHSRLLHALGALHLASRTLQSFRDKGIFFSDEERLALLAAILLHDVGHGPFSHALEGGLIPEASHEKLSEAIIQHLIPMPSPIKEMTLSMLRGSYSTPWFNDMVASQLDMDRLDYLARDSFFTGVSEGVIGAERILSLLTVINGRLAIEEKGIYSIEKFLIARHLMYWQVYLHKTVLSAEFHLLLILKRFRTLWENGCPQVLPHNLRKLLEARSEYERLEAFARMDDTDISYAVKWWAEEAADPWLKDLSRRLMNRQLFKTLMLNSPPPPETVGNIRSKIQEKLGVGADAFYFMTDSLKNPFYNPTQNPILIVKKNGELLPAEEASATIKALAENVRQEKYFLLLPDFVTEELRL